MEAVPKRIVEVLGIVVVVLVGGCRCRDKDALCHQTRSYFLDLLVNVRCK